MTHIILSTNLTMSPQIDDFLKKPPLLNLSSYCSGSVSVTIRIIKQKTQSDKPVGLPWLWSSVSRLAEGCEKVRGPVEQQALAGSTISIPGFSGRDFVKIPGSRDFRDRDWPQFLIPGLSENFRDFSGLAFFV